MLNKPLDNNSYLFDLPAVKYLVENQELRFDKEVSTTPSP
jgi:hypothetical protein